MHTCSQGTRRRARDDGHRFVHAVCCGNVPPAPSDGDCGPQQGFETRVPQGGGCVRLVEGAVCETIGWVRGNWLLHFSGLDIQPTHPLVPPPSNPPIQPAIHLATQLSIRPATHSPIHPSTHPPIHPSSHPPNHFSTHDLRHTSMHRAFRRCIQPATHVAIQASSQPPNHPPTHVGVLGWMRSWWMGGCMGAWVCG